MISRTTKQFWAGYHALPKTIQARADRAYELWLRDPYHPSLQFKRIDPAEPIYSVRIGLGYRALGVVRGNTITWYWIGTHARYDHLVT